MFVDQEDQEIHQRFRFSFDVDVTYRKMALDVQDVELNQLRERLLARPDLIEKLLANQALYAVEVQLENRMRPSGLLDFTSADLLDAAAHRAPADETIPLCWPARPPAAPTRTPRPSWMTASALK